MEPTTSSKGVCEHCGQEKNLKKHLNKMTCSSCQAFRIAAKNYPQRMVDALEEFGELPSEMNTKKFCGLRSNESLTHSVATYAHKLKETEYSKQIRGETDGLNCQSKQVAHNAEKTGPDHDRIEQRLAKMEEYVQRIEQLGEMLSFICSGTSKIESRSQMTEDR